MDYRRYKFTGRENLTYGAESMALSIVVAYLFYHSWIALTSFAVIYPFLLKEKRMEKVQKQKSELSIEFKEAMQSVSGALVAGYSIENAWKEAEKEMQQLYGKDAFIVLELQGMNERIHLNEPIEKLLQEFSLRSDIEDIQTFCQVFQFAKRGGGDFVKIIRTTILRIGAKIDVEREIETTLAARKLEQRIMNVVPVFILLYIDLTSPNFLEGLYGNPMGIFAMSGCLGLYIVALYLSKRIMDISV